MKELPIPFHRLMIPPLLSGDKLRTRRIADIPDFKTIDLKSESTHTDDDGTLWFHLASPYNDYTTVRKCPYAIGQILYVKEDYYAYGFWKPDGFTPGGVSKFRFIGCSAGEKTTNKPDIFYSDQFLPGITMADIKKNTYRAHGWYLRTGMFMFKRYARIFLEITSIKLERLQDISEEEALLEGVEEYEDGTFRNYSFTPGLRAQDGVECLMAQASFVTLIDRIHGRQVWTDNPWIWVISFKIKNILSNAKATTGGSGSLQKNAIGGND